MRSRWSRSWRSISSAAAGPSPCGDAVVGALQRGDGHVGELLGDGVDVVAAAGAEPPRDPVAHAEHAERGDPGVDRAELGPRRRPPRPRPDHGLEHGAAAVARRASGQLGGELGLGADQQPEPRGLGRLPDDD